MIAYFMLRKDVGVGLAPAPRRLHRGATARVAPTGIGGDTTSLHLPYTL